jgi:hypothetical protein
MYKVRETLESATREEVECLTNRVCEALEALGALKLDKSVQLIYGEDIDLAIKALKKQIPKKPINQSSWKACPVCTQGISVTKKTPSPSAVEYCFHCGQKLDWD